MTIKVASSENGTVDDAVHDLMCSFGYNNMEMMVYFASARFDPDEINSKMQSAFPVTTIFGCSSAGEIVSGGALKGTVVAMAFDVESVSDISAYSDSPYRH
jgi:hypothetical protein